MRPARVSIRLRGAVLASAMAFASGGGDGTGAARGQAPAGPPAVAAKPDDLDFANRLLRDRRYDVAADAYEDFLETGPTGPHAAEARYGLATSRLFLGQHEAARREFEAFLKEAPEHPGAPTALFRIGESAYMQGDLPAAREALDRYTKGHPGHPHAETAWPYLGDVCYRLGDLAAARAAYERALEIAPEGRLADRARYGLGRVLAAGGDSDEALKAFETIIAGGGRDWADKARYQLGLVPFEAGQYEKAVAAFESMEENAPSSPLAVEARLRRGESLGHLGRIDEAEAVLGPIAAGGGGIAQRAAYTLATAQLENGRAEQAMTTCDAALGAAGDTPMAPFLLFRSAEAAAKLDRAGEARDRFLRVADEHPRDSWADDALLRAAEIALKAGDGATAESLASQFATRFPDNPLRANARLIRAQAVLGAGRTDDAIALFEGLLAEDRPTPAVANNARIALSSAYRAKKLPEKAAEVLKGVAPGSEGGMSPEASYELGVGHFDAGRYDEAVPALEAYLAGRPVGDVAADALAMLAIAHQERGQFESSDAALERLAREHPESKALAPTLLRLGEAALKGDRKDRAVEQLSKAAEGLNEAEMKARASWGLGWAHLEAGRFVDAVEALSRVLELTPNGELASDAALALGRALEKSGRGEEAVEVYDRELARELDRPAALRAMLARARALDALGRSGDAATAYQRYLDGPREGPSDGPPKPPDEPIARDTVLAEMGWVLLDAGKSDEAAAAFRRILDEFPESPRATDARVVLAEAAYRAGELDRVEALLAPVVAEGSTSDPNLLQEALFCLGQARFDRRDWSAAGEAFGRLSTAFPEGPLRRKSDFWKAESSFQASDAKSAEAQFAALIATPATAVQPAEDWLKTAKLRHAESLVALGRWKDALAAADALKTEAPDFPAMHELDYARGRALQGQALFEEARAAYRAVIAARRADDFAARAQFMCGETYFHQQMYSEAIREFLKVDYNHPDAPSWRAAALLEAGKVAEKMGKWRDAIDFYRTLAAKFPDDEHAKQAAERLEAAERQQQAASTGREPRS